MQLFNYTAKDKSGKILKGKIEATNESAAASMLSSKELFPIQIAPQAEKSSNLFNKVSSKEKTQTIRQLATMINAGLPISQSLKTLEEQAKKPNTKRILSRTFAEIEGGSQLSTAFSRFPETFSALDIALVSSGESSGNLDKALLRLANQLEKQRTITRKITGALVYPAIVIFITIIVVVGLVVFIIPQMEELYTSFNATLPPLTRGLLALSDIIINYGIFILAILAGVTYFLYTVVKKPAGKKVWDNLKISAWPINSLLIKLYAARFSRTLAGLVSSGVPLLDSLEITSKAIGNTIYQEKIKIVIKRVKSGITLSEAIKENQLFPQIVPQMIGVGEQTGEMDTMLENMADYFEEEVDQAVKNISTLIEPLVIVILAVFIVIIMLAVLMPIYQVGQIV